MKRWWRGGMVVGSVIWIGGEVRAQTPAPESTGENVEDVVNEAAKGPMKPAVSLDRPFYNAVQQTKKEMREKIGLEWALSYTAIGQLTSGGFDANAAAEATTNFFALWKPIRDPNGIDGAGIGFQVENRTNYTSDTFVDMTAELGTLWSPNDSTSDDYCQIKQLWVGHRLAEGKITYIIGKLDPGGYINKNRFAGSGNTQYFAQPFAKNPARAFPDNGLGATIRIAPADWIHMDAVVSDGDANSNHNPFSTLGDHWFVAGELVFHPKFEGLGEGNYRLLLWNRESELGNSFGYSLSLDQNLGEKLGVFFRYGGNDGDLSAIEHIAAAGVSFLSPFDRPDDQAGIAVAWTGPSDSSLRDEYSAEVYYRMQLTEGIEFSLSAQIIVDPSASDRDMEGVYGMRMRVLY